MFVKKYLSKKYFSYHREPRSRTSLPSCPSTSPTSTSGSTSAETWLDSQRKHHFNHNLWHYSDKITTTTSKSCSMSAVKWLDSHKHVFECIIFTTTDDINLATHRFFTVWFAPKHQYVLCRFGKRMTWMRMMRPVEKTSGSRQTCYLSFVIVLVFKTYFNLTGGAGGKAGWEN